MTLIEIVPYESCDECPRYYKNQYPWGTKGKCIGSYLDDDDPLKCGMLAGWS